MTVRLRPHHLLCMLTYVGKGYSRAFTDNYDAIAQRIGAGEALELVEGADDICAPLLLTDDPHCFNASVRERDRQAALDVAALLGREIAPGTRFVSDTAALAALRTAFAGGRIRKACTGCEWTSLCDTIAAEAFPAVRVVR